ncbi:MAG: hypothetical protein WCT04_21730 [Planctomycetota bacterium]
MSPTKIAAPVLILSFVWVLSAPALALKPFLGEVRKAFNLGEDEGSCRICHTFDDTKKEKPTEHNVNAFGKDLSRNKTFRSLGELEEVEVLNDKQMAGVRAALLEIARYDSDGDGASNIEELKLGTGPGNPKSTPTADELAKYRNDHPDTTPIAKPAEASGTKKSRKKEDD